MEKINLKQKFSLFQDHWSPKIIGEVNDNFVKLAKLKGEFLWHHHENEDELFVVVKGKLVMNFRDKQVEVNEGEIIIVPKGVDHKPVSEGETHIMLIEPKATLHTGNVKNERTVERLERI